MKYIFYSLIIFLFLSLDIQAQNDPAAKMLEQAKTHIAKGDYDKARLSLNYHNKYVEKLPDKWLLGQTLLIQIALNKNLLHETEKYLNEADKIISIKAFSKLPVTRKVLAQKADFYLRQNQFEKAFNILNKLIKEFKNNEDKYTLINAQLDQTFLKSKEKTAEELKEIAIKIEQFEKSAKLNSLKLIRIKNKFSILSKPDLKQLNSFKSLKDYWLPKDEFSFLNLYLLHQTQQNLKAYNTWNTEKDIITVMTHPATVKVLCQIADSLTEVNPEATKLMISSARQLLRNQQDLSRLTFSEVNYLLKIDKTSDAISTLNEYLEISENSSKADVLRLLICESLLINNDFIKCRQLHAKVDKSKLTDSQWRSKAHYIEAELLHEEGKIKEAAMLFLRVGQTAKNENLLLTALYKAGQSYSQLKDHQNAIRAYKQLTVRERHKYKDQAYASLYKAHELIKEYDKALAVINEFIIKGENAGLKEEALHDKGHIQLKNGDQVSAIKTFQDFAVIYPKNKRSAPLLFEVYKIQKNTEDLQTASNTLKTIIKKAKGTAPDTYSLALHNLALIQLFEGQSRQSIELWQEFLEFNQNRNFYLTDQVKLQLASVYQSSNDLNPSVAANIYVDIITNSKRPELIQKALTNLLSIKAQGNNIETALLKLIKRQKNISRVIWGYIIDWMMKQDLNQKNTALLSLFKESSMQIKQHKQINPYRKAQMTILEAAFSDNKETRSELLKEALSLILKSGNNSYESRELQIAIYQGLDLQTKALNLYLDLIYDLQYKISTDSYMDWKLYHKSCLAAASLLISQKRSKEVTPLKNRILKASLPGHQKIISAIDLLIEEKSK